MTSIPEAHYRVSIKGCVFEQGKLMLVLNNGTYDLPGGGIDHGESQIQALYREINEELGVDVVSHEKQPVYFLTMQSKGGRRFANVFWECSLSTYNITPFDECESIEFYTRDEILDMGKLIQPQIRTFVENIVF